VFGRNFENMNILYYQVPITEVKHAPLARLKQSARKDFYDAEQMEGCLFYQVGYAAIPVEKPTCDGCRRRYGSLLFPKLSMLGSFVDRRFMQR